jgi:hypothetical protein
LIAPCSCEAWPGGGGGAHKARERGTLRRDTGTHDKACCARTHAVHCAQPCCRLLHHRQCCACMWWWWPGRGAVLGWPSGCGCLQCAVQVRNVHVFGPSTSTRAAASCSCFPVLWVCVGAGVGAAAAAPAGPRTQVSAGVKTTVVTVGASEASGAVGGAGAGAAPTADPGATGVVQPAFKPAKVRACMYACTA